MKSILENKLRSSKSLPFLFIGSGLSRRYLDLEDWEGLVKLFAGKARLGDEFAYRVYENRAKKEGIYSEDILPAISEYIEEDFNNISLTSEDYIEFREVYKKEIHLGKSPFKIACAEHFKKAEEKFTTDNYLSEIKKFKKLKKHVAGIITTNYDNFLEHVFSDFKPYIGQNELLFNPSYGMAEIYKIHGCCSDSESLIVTAKDYVGYNQKNRYLAAKLLTIFLEHPIIFMGYSLNDPNVKAILGNIAECLNEEQLDFLKQRLFYVDWSESPKELEISDYTKEFAGGKTIEMTKISLHDYSDLYTVITKCQMKYSPKVLRHLKSDIYELVATNDPKNRLYVSNIDDNTNLDKVDVVIGVGVMGEIGRAGYGSVVKIIDIFEDILFDNKSYVSEWVVEDSLSNLLNHHHGSVPMYKYLNTYEKEYPIKVKEALKDEYDQFLNGTLIRSRKSNPFTGDSIEEIISKCDISNLSEIGRILRELLIVPCELLDEDKIGNFLRNVWNSQPNIFNETPKSNYRKLIMIYDWLKYAKK